MIELDFKLPPIWDQVKDAKYGDLEELDYYQRYELMNMLGREYAGNMVPENQGAYSRMLAQEGMLRDLFIIDGREPIQYDIDTRALEQFNKRVIESGKFEEWQRQWSRRDNHAQQGVALQISRMFSESFGANLKTSRIHFAPTDIVNAEVDVDSGDLTLSDTKVVRQDFLKFYHSVVYANARLYQERLATNKIPFDEGGEREDLAFRTYGDLSPSQSMFWDTSGFDNFMNQPTRRHAMWLADTATESLAAAYDPDREHEVVKDIRAEMNSRYMSAKVLYAASMPVFASEDVSHALTPIFEHHIRGLTIEAQHKVVMLASKMHARGESVPGHLNDAIDKIMTSYPLTDEYKRFQVDKQRDLLFRMMSDTRVQDARQNWQNYNTTKRLDFLQHAVNIHAEVFGCRAARVEAIDIPPRPDTESNRKIIHYGGYLWRQRNPVIQINVNEQAGATDNFFEAFNTAMHEAQHNFQDSLASRYENNFMKPDDPLYEQARYFLTGSYVYVNPDQNRTHYHNNLLERDAFAVGNGLSYFMALANAEQREEYTVRMQALLEDPSRHDLDLSRGFPNAPWHNQPPMPEPEA